MSPQNPHSDQETSEDSRSSADKSTRVYRDFDGKFISASEYRALLKAKRVPSNEDSESLEGDDAKALERVTSGGVNIRGNAVGRDIVKRDGLDEESFPSYEDDASLRAWFRRNIYNARQLDERPQFESIKLERRDLSHMDMQASIFIECAFTRCNLTNASFQNSDLRRIDLSGADLRKADFQGANLSNANLIDVDLTDADLTGANLADAKLTGANLTGANFTGANLTNAGLADAKLTGVNLSGAILPAVIPINLGPSKWDIQSVEEEQNQLPADEVKKSGGVDEKSATDDCQFKLDLRHPIPNSQLALTPQFLLEEVLPFLAAVADIQHVIDEIKGRQPRSITIQSITAGSIAVVMNGVKEAIVNILKVIVPWRNSHISQLDELALAERRAEIEKKNAEALLIQAQAAKTNEERNAIAADAALRRQHAEELRLRYEKMSQAFEREKMPKYIEFIDVIEPSTVAEDQLARLAQLIGPLNTVTHGSVQIQIVNFSGGTFFTAQGDVKVGRDVTGRDKISA